MFVANDTRNFDEKDFKLFFDALASCSNDEGVQELYCSLCYRLFGSRLDVPVSKTRPSLNTKALGMLGKFGIATVREVFGLTMKQLMEIDNYSPTATEEILSLMRANQDVCEPSGP
jgi:hypothetical protein